MPRFFTDNINASDLSAVIEGADAAHIANSLRMRPGEELILCDLAGTDYRCEITSLSKGAVFLRILDNSPSAGETGVYIRLFQALPKADKLETIVQKATELGAAEVIPVLTSRCVSRPDAKSMEKKRGRLAKIALEAAKQSGRGRIPAIGRLHSFAEAVEAMRGDDAPLFFYENAEKPLRDVLPAGARNISVFIGSEGGFSPEEAELARKAGLLTAGLGPRILRCETAPVAAISAVLYAFKEF
jgi:16S rRNA (uracil1498-N3)-methyltransferase